MILSSAESPEEKLEEEEPRSTLGFEEVNVIHF